MTTNGRAHLRLKRGHPNPVHWAHRLDPAHAGGRPIVIVVANVVDEALKPMLNCRIKPSQGADGCLYFSRDATQRGWAIR